MGITLDRNTVNELTVPNIYFDDTLKGFGVRVRTSAGGKLLRSWVIQYRVEGKQRRLKLGDVVKLNPDLARKRATEMLAKVTLGHDPADEKQAARAAASLTFSKAVAEYLGLKKPEVRASSLKITTLYLTGKKYFGGLHAMPLTKVTRSDVSTAINKITVGSGASSASRARASERLLRLGHQERARRPEPGDEQRDPEDRPGAGPRSG